MFSPTIKKILSGILFAASLAMLALIIYLAVAGFPAPEWLHWHKLKSIRKPFLIFLSLFFAAFLIVPDRKKKLESLTQMLSRPTAVWILVGVYAILFLWHEIAEYLSIEINFIPFGFYDYMLYYFFHGKMHFTGELHGFYHINNAMFLLAPAWAMVQSSLVLILAYPLILAGAAVPLASLARRYFPNSTVPFVAAFIFLNFRYVQGLLEMNFTVEGFYPLFIFSLVYFAICQSWVWYGVFLLLTLSIKEDAPFYLMAFGFLLVWMRGKRMAGLVTIVAAAGYFYWVHHVLIAWTGNDIFHGDTKNFAKYGSTPLQVLGYVLLHMPDMLREFLGTKEAWRTLIKLCSNLMFLPVLSSFMLAVLASLFPLFIRGGESFVNLQFQYSAAVIGFLFPAFLDGLRKIHLLFAGKRWWREIVFPLVLIGLVFLNAGNFRTPQINREDLKTIALAKSIPVDAVLVTHGHLLPYIGYRKYNFYLQAPLENPARTKSDKQIYDHADYYLLARGVNLFPMNQDFFDKKLLELKARKDLELVHDDGTRYLFKKK
ncbi:MAG: DUF2079 domain-containing protein [Candidatus Omnitrophica bacterium]|nr:DUF2079 domain-containing protein [Candidatus Omnitrophota bacterium]